MTGFFERTVPKKIKAAERPHRITIILALFAAALTAAALVWNHSPREQQPPAAKTQIPTQALQIDKIDQKVQNGNAVAGVQGNVTVDKPVTKIKTRVKTYLTNHSYS